MKSVWSHLQRKAQTLQRSRCSRDLLTIFSEIPCGTALSLPPVMLTVRLRKKESCIFLKQLKLYVSLLQKLGLTVTNNIRIIKYHIWTAVENTGLHGAAKKASTAYLAFVFSKKHRRKYASFKMLDCRYTDMCSIIFHSYLQV